MKNTCLGFIVWHTCEENPRRKKASTENAMSGIFAILSRIHTDVQSLGAVTGGAKPPELHINRSNKEAKSLIFQTKGIQ